MVTIVTSSTACLQLAPVRVEQPVVGHAPTLDFATILPEVSPVVEEVNIGAACTDRPFTVGGVFDVDGEVLSYRYFMLFTDASQGVVRRLEMSSGQLLPLPADPSQFQGPLLLLGKGELESEFFGNSLADLVTPRPTADEPVEKKIHLLQLVIADKPFVGAVEEDTLAAGAGRVEVDWSFYIVDEDCGAPAEGS